MTYEEIQRRQTAVPFVRYVLFMADGREIEVLHPEVIAIEPQARTLLLYHASEFGEVIDLQLIVSLKYRIEEFLSELPGGV
jgi:hypothetical protein